MTISKAFQTQKDNKSNKSNKSNKTFKSKWKIIFVAEVTIQACFLMGCSRPTCNLHVMCAGVQSYTVDYTQQKATVVGTADPETILSAIRKSGKMATLKGQQAAQAEAAPKQEKKEEKEEAKSGEIKEEQSTEEKKEPKPRLSFRETFRSKLANRPKMADLRQKMSNLSNLKMQELQKRMPDICNSMPKNFMTNACREFISHGVFYVEKGEWSEDEDSVKKI